ncbi:glycosyltransferase family 2 protein [Thiomicrospira microaerophila]|uniref:glycosyltransferase family 2 protein n=1 Tax=Thiomicrospira microaerophila TaxID=406020 RepID=UPI000698BAE6|nr:glycosyltransferase family A protein [Thiomicrospira microaerophila]
MEQNKPFFSVVMPLYNKRNHVKETIESVFAQTFQDFEIVVVNDGSTDDSAEVVASIDDPRIRLIHQQNAGVSVARNNGIKQANADYIAFLDADDIWLPEFLQTIYDLIQSYPDAGLYATSYFLKNLDGMLVEKEIKFLPEKKFKGLIPNYFKSATYSHLVWSSATCIPRSIFLNENIWFPAGVKYYEDVYVWGKVALIKDMAYNTNACAVYVLCAENNTRDASSKVYTPRKILQELKKDACLARNDEIKKWLHKYVDRDVYGSVIRSKMVGGTKNAIDILFNHKMSPQFFIPAAVIAFMPMFLFNGLRWGKRTLRYLFVSK